MKAGWYFIWHLNAHLKPVHLLGVAHSLEVLRVVGGIVDGGHRTPEVKILDKHAFLVEVGDSQRPLNTSHSALCTPAFHCLQEGCSNFAVVHHLYEAEAHTFLLPLRIGMLVDDGGNASDRYTIAIGHKRLDFTKLQASIVTRTEGVAHIGIKIRYILRVIGIDTTRQRDKIVHVFTGVYGNNLNVRHTICIAPL